MSIPGILLPTQQHSRHPLRSGETPAYMSAKGLFLGLEHDFSQLPSTGTISFWPCQRLIDKITQMIAKARATAVLHPGTASKIYGMINFRQQGTYGRIGANGLTPITKRQYEKGTSLTVQILTSFEVIEVVLRDKSRRQFFIFPPPCLRFAGASDVALERPKQGTGGFCIVWMDGPGETRSPSWRTYLRPCMTCGNLVTERLHNWRWLSSCKHWYADHTHFVSDAECGSSITWRFS